MNMLISNVLVDLAPHIVAFASVICGVLIPLFTFHREHKRQMEARKAENTIKIADHLQAKNQAHLNDILPLFSKFIECALSKTENALAKKHAKPVEKDRKSDAPDKKLAESVDKIYSDILIRLRLTNKYHEEINAHMQKIKAEINDDKATEENEIFALAKSVREYVREEAEIPTDVISSIINEALEKKPITKNQHSTPSVPHSSGSSGGGSDDSVSK